MPTQEHPLVSTLRRLPLFTDLSDEELQAIARQAKREIFERGDVLFSEGQPCRDLLIVEIGAVRLFKTSSQGRQQLIGIERRGSLLAEAPAFDGGLHTATAEAMESMSVLRVEARHFQTVCLQYPTLAMKVIKVLGHRVRHLDSLVEQLSFATVRARLASHLVRLARERGTPTAQGVEFSLTENNEELAARLGTVRELISRNLGRLYGEKLILMRGRSVAIPDLAALQAEASESN